MSDLMIDLETLGTEPGSVILSIGAYELETEKTFYRVIDLKDSVSHGMTIDPDTIKWWMKQKDLSVFQDPKAVALKEALMDFSSGLAPAKELNVWGDGANFDITLTECAYRAVKLPIPWKYVNIKCYRTLKEIYKGIKKVRHGIHHNALDDAISNGRHLKQILDHIKSRSK